MEGWWTFTGIDWKWFGLRRGRYAKPRSDARSASYSTRWGSRRSRHAKAGSPTSNQDIADFEWMLQTGNDFNIKIAILMYLYYVTYIYIYIFLASRLGLSSRVKRQVQHTTPFLLAWSGRRQQSKLGVNFQLLADWDTDACTSQDS